MEYPSNSQNKRIPPEAKIEPKVVEPVVTGSVTRKKPNIGKRLKNVLFGGDVDSVVGFVVYDILVPAVKDTLSDIVSGGIERALYGEGRGGPSRRARSSGHATGFTNYGGVSSSRGTDRYGNEPRRISQGARIAQSFDEIILETRVEAETVIERLSDLCDQYGQATVADLYDLCRITGGDFTDRKYGWFDMRGVSISRARGGLYMLDMPKPVELK